MDKEELSRQLAAAFLGELEEHVQSINRVLLEVERQSITSDDAVRDLMRSLHTLKGAARAAGYQMLEQAFHLLENVLIPVRDGSAEFDSTLVSTLFDAADALDESVMRLRENSELGGGRLEQLIGRLVDDKTDVQGPPRHATSGEDKPSDDQVDPPAADQDHKKTSPPPPATDRASTSSRPSGSTVRLAADKLDRLMTQSGEMLVARRRMEMQIHQVESLRDFVSSSLQNLEKIRSSGLETSELKTRGNGALTLIDVAGEELKDLDKQIDRLSTRMIAEARHLKVACESLEDEVHRVRMFPFSEACLGMERMVRDLALDQGKRVEFLIQGSDLEVDRSIIEAIKDPLLHLVRNAVDHGLEPPGQRLATGKSEVGRLEIAASLKGAQIEIVVSDDGRGLDFDALREQARARGMTETADHRDLARLIFLPGLSTARKITDISGRGVGMDVAQDRIEALHGFIDMSSQPGAGTQFVITLPITLTTLRGLLVQANGHTYAFPSSQVERLVHFQPDEVGSAGGKPVLLLDHPISLVSLTRVLGQETDSIATGRHGRSAVIVHLGKQRLGFVVDEISAEQEIVVKTLGKRLAGVRKISGAIVLESGRLALLLNVASLVRAATGVNEPELIRTQQPAPEPTRDRILYAEDSVTTRTLVRSILEAAGFDVRVATDGQTAWNMLNEEGADLVVSDVEMPRMNGFELTQAIRRSAQFRDLPVILVTGLGSPDDKMRGADAGADAYLVKSSFDQQSLLDAIQQLL